MKASKDEPITRQEVAKMIGVAYAYSFKIRDFPIPVKAIGVVKYYSIESVEQHIKDQFNPDINEIIQLNNQGLTRLEMAKILNVEKSVIYSYCYRNKIRSLRTVKNSGSKVIKEYEIPKKDVVFNAFMFQMVRQ